MRLGVLRARVLRRCCDCRYYSPGAGVVMFWLSVRDCVQVVLRVVVQGFVISGGL